jgi:hypothetical protein
MNKHIKDIALQVGGSHYPEVNSKLLEKFAEAIVLECACQADSLGSNLAGFQDYDGRDICYSVRDTIKEHFGVK